MPGIGGLASGELGGIGGAPSTGGGGGVTQLIAGTNITLSPSSGLGTVTISSTAGGGSVTTVSVVTANGMAGTVANASTTPAITLTTTVGTSGSPAIVKANGTAFSAAVSGTDYAPGTSAAATGLVVSTTGTGALTTVAAPAGTVVGTTDTQTLTNKRITRRTTTLSGPGATPTFDTDNFDVIHLTALAAAITSMTTGVTGTPQDGDSLVITFTDNGTARAIAWGTLWESSTVSLPITTVAGLLLTVGFLWDAVGSKWNCVMVA